MASILIRCTGGTDIAADALAGWLDSQITRIDDNVRVMALRLASVERVDEFNGHRAGWLVELEVADDQAAQSDHFVAQMLGDMRLLGLGPAVFVPSGSATVPAPDVDAGSYAIAVHSGSA